MNKDPWLPILTGPLGPCELSLSFDSPFTDVASAKEFCDKLGAYVTGLNCEWQESGYPVYMAEAKLYNLDIKNVSKKEKLTDEEIIERYHEIMARKNKSDKEETEELEYDHIDL